MATEIKVPSIGESISEVQIGEWQRKEGDQVDKDETIVTLDSEKATVDVPAPAAGRLVKIVKGNGETATIGEVIGTIDSGEGGESRKEEGEETKPDEAAKSKQTEKRPDKKPSDKSSAGSSKAKETQSRKSTQEEPRVMPAAQRLLKEHGLKAEQIEATGPGGRMLKEDVLAHVESSKGADNQGVENEAEAGDDQARDDQEQEDKGQEDDQRRDAEGAEDGKQGERREEVVPLTPLRKTVARRLVEAQRTMAILTTFNEVDLSAVMALRKEHQGSFQQRYNAKLGFMSFFVKAVVAGLKENPRLNAEIRGNDIVLRHYYDICVAIGAGKGLVVPPLRNAGRLSFAEIELAISDLAQRARENKLAPHELQGGTFTISNGGVYGSLLSTPIVNPPQSGILGLHSIQDRPVARDGQVVIRPMMYVALSYDHRIVDGREAVTFLKTVKEYVESPGRLLIES